MLVGAALVAALAVPAATVHAAPAGAPPGRAVAPVEGQPACGTELPASAARRHAADHAASPVRVATYNFLHARGTSNASLDARIPLLVDAIARARADILGVQEVEELGSRGFTTARVSRGLANATGRA